jgi:hypothetical protein
MVTPSAGNATTTTLANLGQNGGGEGIWGKNGNAIRTPGRYHLLLCRRLLNIYIYMYLNIYMYMYTYMYVCVYICMCVCVCVCVCACVCVCV